MTKEHPLSRYRAKRTFSNTPEPPGEIGSSPERLFSIQEHHARRLHYDLRIQMDGVLKSWALPKGIPERAGERRLAMKTEDHPVAYRDFEGTIPAGNYGAGRVILWDTGTYEVISGSPQSGKLHLLLNGKRTHGQFTLVRTRMQGEKDAWLMLKSEPKLPRGASSLPERIIPMEAAQAEAPFSDPEWVFERKWDGVRAIGRIERQSRAPSIRLWGRSLKDLGEFYPELIEGLSALLES